MMYAGNLAEFVGTVSEDIRISHIIKDQVFYKMVLRVRRKSGVIDEVPTIIRETILKQCNVKKGSRVSVRGRIQTHVEWNKNKKSVEMYIKVTNLKVALNMQGDKNVVYLSGIVETVPILRKTLDGMEVVKFLISTEIGEKRRVKLPCVVWGEKANFLALRAEKYNRLNFIGRFQSRQNGEVEQKMTYELCIRKMF